jgi:hypothetical protein
LLCIFPFSRSAHPTCYASFHSRALLTPLVMHLSILALCSPHLLCIFPFSRSAHPTCYASFHSRALLTPLVMHLSILALCSPHLLYIVLSQLDTDPEERHDVGAAPEQRSRVNTMHAAVMAGRASAYNPVRGNTDPRACIAALARGGFWGPFVE